MAHTVKKVKVMERNYFEERIIIAIVTCNCGVEFDDCCRVSKGLSKKEMKLNRREIVEMAMAAYTEHVKEESLGGCEVKTPMTELLRLVRSNKRKRKVRK